MEISSHEVESLRKDAKFIRLVKFGVFAFFLVVIAMMGGCPVYKVWQQGLEGKAELRRAEQNRQIKIEEAKAVEESSFSLAQAEIIRANGVAEANEIIAGGLGGAEGYLRYLWIQGLNDGKGERIYIPTEAGIPILEARDNPSRKAND